MISRSTRYERWDGSQEPFGRDAEELFDRLAEDLFQGGDFDYALHRLMSRGWRDRQGKRLPGFEEMLERLRKKKLQELDRLPEDVGGTIRKLNDYEFMDEGAAHSFQQLMEELKQQISQTYFKNMTRTMQQLRPEHLGEIKEMLKALNQMLRDRLEGRPPKFEQFMQRFGHFFGPNPPKTLDELIQHLERQ